MQARKSVATPTPPSLRSTAPGSRELPARAHPTSVMGIVNVTPDSFSDGGNFLLPTQATQHAYRLAEEGADIIDIGAESTRPGHQSISAEEEWHRLRPVLQELCANTRLTISVDTTKASVAKQALELGVQIINDVWGGLADEAMIPLIAASDCTYIWMHNRREPAPTNGFQVLVDETKVGVEALLAAGVSRSRIWIDPGIGFGKTHQQNLATLQRLPEYCALGYPVLLGTSRKRVVGRTLGLPVDERLEGSLATVALGVTAGVHAVRVHDVLASVRTCRTVEEILGAKADV